MINILTRYVTLFWPHYSQLALFHNFPAVISIICVGFVLKTFYNYSEIVLRSQRRTWLNRYSFDYYIHMLVFGIFLMNFHCIHVFFLYNGFDVRMRGGHWVYSHCMQGWRLLVIGTTLDQCHLTPCSVILLLQILHLI